MEVELNGAKLRVHEDGTIERFAWNRWRCMIGTISVKGYHQVDINNKNYMKHRIVGLAFLGLDITNKKIQIDHIDRNKSNNHVSNLRVVSNQQNQFNVFHKGYSWSNQWNKYRARITLNKKTIHLGYFENEEDAQQAYLSAKKMYHII